jgi:hypothetical protein
MTRSADTRLTALERRIKFLYLALFALVGLFVFVASTTEKAAETIRCGKLEVVDSDGNLVAMVGVDNDGSRGLFVYDSSERVRLASIYDQSQTAWYALDSSGTIRVGVAQYAHGGGGVALHGPDGKGAAVLYYKAKGTLTFYDTDGKVIAQEPE